MYTGNNSSCWVLRRVHIYSHGLVHTADLQLWQGEYHLMERHIRLLVRVFLPIVFETFSTSCRRPCPIQFRSPIINLIAGIVFTDVVMTNLVK